MPRHCDLLVMWCLGPEVPDWVSHDIRGSKQLLSDIQQIRMSPYLLECLEMVKIKTL